MRPQFLRTDARQTLIGMAIGLLIALAAGVGAWWWMKPAPVVETAAPEVKQEDGSVIAERAPNAKAKPKQMLPKGAKLERTAEFKVQGQGLKMPDGELKPCPPVKIDTSLIREADGGRRLIVSSPDGQVLRAVDIPVETAAPPPEPKVWAAGLSIDPARQAMGIWLERDVMRLRVGVEINQSQGGRAMDGAAVRFRVGMSF